MNPIIMPVRNGLHYTRNAVADCLAQDIGDVELLVIDNSATDGTTPWLHTQPVTTMHLSPPRSVAASWNRGLRWAFQRADYALVVNNDVRLRPDTYRWLVEDGGGFVTAVGTRDASKIEGCNPPNNEAKRPHPDFSCFLIRKWVYEKVGPFDESFVGAYCEDANYHLRMHEAGIDAVCLDLPFWHAGAGTIKSAGQDQADAIRILADANRELFRRKHGVDVGSQQYYAQFGHGSPVSE